MYNDLGCDRNDALMHTPFEAMSAKLEKSDSRLDSRNLQDYGEYSESGVDISLIKYLLSLPPIERVLLMERRARETSWMREHARPCTKTRPG
jgi:hypothetical protein